MQRPSRTCGTQEPNEAFTSTRVKTKGTWQRVPPVRQSSIGHVTKSLKGRSQRPNHTDQHMPRQAHHKCSPGRGIVNDGSAPCATILPRHPESQVGPRPSTLRCVHPGALHHGTTILILPSQRRCRPAKPQATESKLFMRPTCPHHHGHEPPMDGSQLYGRGGALVECSPCPLRVLQGSTVRRVTTIPKQFPF